MDSFGYDIELSPQSSMAPEITSGQPFVGMEFQSIDEARIFYEDYGKKCGFWMRTRTTQKGKTRCDDVTTALFVCSCGGKHKNEEVSMGEESREVGTELGKMKTRTCSTIKVGCLAHMRVRIDRHTLKWKVVAFNDEHNHNLVTPMKRMKMRSNRHMPKTIKNLTESFHRDNLVVGKVSDLFGGDQVGFTSNLCAKRQIELENGDVQSVLTYFRKKQAENPGFFYALQCDEVGRVTNFFWVDARSRMAYRFFGDVVTFDTTYRTNKYNMSFVPFTGINHHFQTIQFGCALLQDETEETFLWLFDTWLEAMGGSPPISIITDQNLTMKGAIAKVFPNSRHRLCLWHIKKKFVEKLSHVYFTKPDFKKKMKACIHWTYTEEDFEDQWRRLMMQFNLVDNEWLQHLYEIRASWVPIYNRQTFFAGMNTTGRSEGINSFFDEFVAPKTNLREFVVRYDQALKRLVKNEINEDFESEHKNCIVPRGEFLLRHAADVYTRTMYTKFKGEWDMVYQFKSEDGECNQDWQYFHVRTRESVDVYPQHFVVHLNLLTHVGTCSCKHFEFSGMICRHLMKVLSRLDLERIPEHFIMGRWRKDANSFRVMDSGPLVTDGDSEHGEALRLNHMTQEATKLALGAAPYNESYVIYMETMKDLSERLGDVITSALANRGPIGKASLTASNDPVPSLFTPPVVSLLVDPKISQTKGRKKDTKEKEVVASSSRIKSGIELATEKKKRKCKSCGQLARHDSRNCPLNLDRRRRNEDNKDNSEMEED